VVSSPHLHSLKVCKVHSSPPFRVVLRLMFKPFIYSSVSRSVVCFFFGLYLSLLTIWLNCSQVN
jgi:hypothetical protein